MLLLITVLMANYFSNWRKCEDAFRSGDHAKAVQLLPLVKEPHQIWDFFHDCTLLHWSARNGWLDVTKDLITNYHFDPQERNDYRKTCLHYAAEGNHVDVVRYLITECNCDQMATACMEILFFTLQLLTDHLMS